MGEAYAIADRPSQGETHTSTLHVEAASISIAIALPPIPVAYSRNHALLQTSAGWRLSPAYDIVPVPLVSQESRDLAMEVEPFGRAGSLYNLLSDCGAFGLSTGEAQALIEHMLSVVKRWCEFFAKNNVEAHSIEVLEQAILPDCFYRAEPMEPV